MSGLLILFILAFSTTYIIICLYILIEYWDENSFEVRGKEMPIRFDIGWEDVDTKYDALMALLKSIVNFFIWPLLPFVVLFHLSVFYSTLPDDQTDVERLKRASND